MYACESWTVKKSEHRRIDVFEVWCWRRLLRVPWTARRSNQSILKEISPGYSLEGQMLRLKLPYFATSFEELSHWKRPWCWGRLGAGEGDSRGWDGMALPTRWTWVWVNSGSWWWTGRPSVLWFKGSQRVGHNWVTELNWTECSQKGFPGGSDGKESFYSAGDSSSTCGSGRSPRGGHVSPLQYSCLENSMDRGAWRGTVHGVTKSWTWLSD